MLMMTSTTTSPMLITSIPKATLGCGLWRRECRQMPIDVVGVSLVYGCDRLIDLEEDGPNGWEVQNHGECGLRTDKRQL